MLPLTGLRILAVEQYGAGPFGTLFLADLGAEVIKIEQPGSGDVARGVGPFFVGAARDDASSLFYQAFNRNKRSLTLDLGAVEGQRVFHDLARGADAVASNLRGDVPAKLGLTYTTLGKIKATIVCAHLSAYGRDGPRADWPGYDYLMQAEAGYFAVTGEPGGAPARMGLSIVDFMTGLMLAFALVAAVLEARTTGKGRDIDVSLFDAALFNLSYLAAWYLNAGHNQGREPRSAHPSITPCQLYKTADGWIFIMCNKEKFWQVLCEKLDHREWIGDPRFGGFPARLQHRDTLTELLDGALTTKSTTDWLAHFAGAVPAAPLLDVAQALDNPFVSAREGIQTLVRSNGEAFRLLASPVRCAGETPPHHPAPALGADTDALLEELGYSAERIADLRWRRVI